MIEPYFFDAHIFTTYSLAVEEIDYFSDVISDGKLPEYTIKIANSAMDFWRKLRNNCEQTLVENRGKLS